ncbi:MAG TPA: exopolysaccharide biosynthesis protein [Candidatus Saccharimonadales bacterium]|nr:exopolysaccharide biosynthesis protein [Candidatus Saccharimonadales bacterium]
MPVPKKDEQPFSDQLEKWLKGRQPKTLASLDKVFEDKSFAITFLLLMILPALPLPTGGVTHVFEVIVILLCLELIAGRQTIWLPEKWKHMSLGKTLTGKVIPTILKWIRWLEQRSSPRWRRFFSLPLMPRLLGLITLLFTLGALLAPPFSGLDTLPSLGVVVVSLAIILEDVIMLLAGVVIGATGIGLTIALGTAVFESFHHFF